MIYHDLSAIASRLQTSLLQEKILHKTGIITQGDVLTSAAESFEELTDISVLSGTFGTSTPKLMSILAESYFGVVDKGLVTDFQLSERQQALLQCVRAPNAQDFLTVIPIEGLGLKMSAIQYRTLLSYRFGIPIFSGKDLCHGCNLNKMDEWGDHAVHCSHDVGVKFRHNGIRDVLFDVAHRAGATGKKEATMGFFKDAGGALKPADLLLFGWEGGKDACIDVVCSSPFAAVRTSGFIAGNAVSSAESRKKSKYQLKCAEHGYGFYPFSVGTFGEVGGSAKGILDRIVRIAIGNGMATKNAQHMFGRISFAIMKGVGAQLVSRLPTNFM